MAPPLVPLRDLSVAVQSAVEKVLAQHGASGIDKLWVGFVAPEAAANIETASKIASQMNQQLPGLNGTPSVAQLSAPGGVSAQPHAAQTEGAPAPIPPRGHLIGLVYQAKLHQ